MKYKTYSELIRDLDNNTSLVDIVKYYSLRDRIDKIQLPNINAENINGELK